MFKSKKLILAMTILLTMALLVGCSDDGSDSDNDNVDASYGISGQVVDGAGNGLAEVKISISNNSSVTTNDDGKWSATVKGTVTVTPVKEEYTFDPENKTVSSTSSNLDFVGTKQTNPDTFTFNEGTIEGYDIAGGTEVVIPAEIGGVTVEVIGSEAFKDKGLTSVEIADSVTTIEATAFTGNELTKIVIGSDVKIADGAFDTNFKEAYNLAGTYLKEDGVWYLSSDISGQIVDGVGNAIAGVSILVDGEEATITGEDGKWNTTILGEVTITPNKDGYIFDPENKIVSESTADINFVGVYNISGQVVDDSGSGLVGVSIKVDGQEVTTTDSNGQWSATASGEVTITSSKDGYMFEPDSKTVSGATADMKFVGKVVYDISGQVVDGTGNGLADIDILINGEKVTSTASNGEWSAIVSGEVTIIPSKDDYIFSSVTVNEATANIIFTRKEVTGAEYFYFNNGVITGYKKDEAITDLGEKNALNIIIPSTINGFSVTEIRSEAFRYTNNLESVTIPDSVEKIGGYAFIGNNLTEVIIPDSVTEIGKWAFSSNSLESLVLGSSLQIIGDYAFQSNDLTELTIPNNVTKIGMQAFAQNNLNSLVVESSQVNINDAWYPTYGTPSNQITKLTLNMNTITSTIIDSLKLDKADLKSVIIGNEITEIGDSAFKGCSLETVTIGNSVTSIGDYAFYENALTELIIPDGVTSIGDGAFYKNALTELIIPDGVTSIGSSAFFQNNLESLVLGNSLEIIENAVFWDNNLTEVTIPDSVTKIYYNAFTKNKLTKVIMPSGVDLRVIIGTDRNKYYPFSDNGSLKTVYDANSKTAGTYILSGDTGQWVMSL